MYIIYLFCYLMIIISSSNANQKDDLNITEVEVTASRLKQNPQELGSSYSVITKEEIQNLGINFALDAISLTPGVTTNQNGPFGGVASVRIRGADSEQTLVLYDGIPINDPSSPGGGFDFSRIDINEIEKIEILRGTHSTLWGSDAIGGVISITSKQNENKISRNFYSEVGSYNTLRAGASVGRSNINNRFRLGFSQITSDGISKADKENGNLESDPYTSSMISGNGTINLAKDMKLSSSIRWSDTDAKFDNFGPVDGDLSTKTSEIVGNLYLEVPIKENIINYLSIGYSGIDRNNFTNLEKTFESLGKRLNLRYQGDFIVSNREKIAFGIEREETKADQSKADINSFFALHEFKPLKNFTITSGVRIDDHNTTGSKETLRFASAYQFNDSIKLTASWAEGFKVPTIFQSTYICNFCGLTEPNTNLKPETSKSWDLGFYYSNFIYPAELGLVYFNLKTNNEIGFSFTKGYDNIEEVKSQGIELYGLIKVSEKINISGNYSYIDAKQFEQNRSISKPRIRVPKHSGNIIINYILKDKINTSLIFIYNGKETDSFSTIGQWYRFDISGSYEINDRVEVYSKIENLLNKKYQQITGYGTPDLSGSLGLRLRM